MWRRNDGARIGSLFRKGRPGRAPGPPFAGELLDLGPAPSAFGQADRIVVDVTERNMQMLVVRRGEQVFASQARCPHLGRRLDDAVIRAGGITCRAHGHCFDLRTGLPRTGSWPTHPPARSSLAVYPAWIENGMLRVLLPPR
jgi:nitrite reductase/ring-hydroxylating ferredoxin subunit